MTEVEWNEMSNQQRYEYVSAGEIKVEQYLGFRGDSKVNDDSAKAYLCFIAYSNGVQLSNNCDTKEEALQEAADNMKALAT